MLNRSYENQSAFSIWFWHCIKRLVGSFVYLVLPFEKQYKEKLILSSHFKYGAYSIYCDQITYIRKNKKIFLFNKIANIYKFYCKVSDEAPKDVKKVMEQDVYLPDISFRPFTRSLRLHMLFEAYMDILAARLHKVDESIS